MSDIEGGGTGKDVSSEVVTDVSAFESADDVAKVDVEVANLRDAAQAVVSGVDRSSELSEWQLQDAIRDRVYVEFGDRGLEMKYLIYFSNVNRLPTEEGWGFVGVSLEGGYEVAMNFIRANAEEALRINNLLRKRGSQFDSDSNFTISIRDRYLFAKAGITPDQIFDRVKKIKDTLVWTGGFTRKKYPNLFKDLSISLDMEDNVSFLFGQLNIRVDACKSIAQNLATIRMAASDGNPKSIRAKLNIPDEENLANVLDDKAWLIFSLQREQGGQQISGCDWIEFINIGEANIEPTKANWGHMTIDRNSGDEEARAFILENIGRVREIDLLINQSAQFVARGAALLGLDLFTTVEWRDQRRLISSDEFSAKQMQLIQILKGNGTFRREEERCFQVVFGNVNHVYYQKLSTGGDFLRITVAIASTPEEMARYIVTESFEKGFLLAA